MSANDIWINKRLFMYQDATFGTAGTINITQLSVAKELDDYTNYENQVEPIGLSIMIRNDVNKSKTIIFSYYDCVLFVTKITKVLKSISKLPVSTIYSLKKKRQLTIEIIQSQDGSNSRFIKIAITDSDNSSSNIIVTTKVLYVISVLFKNYVQSYMNLVNQASIDFGIAKLRNSIKMLYKTSATLNNNITAVVSKLSRDITSNQNKVEDKSTNVQDDMFPEDKGADVEPLELDKQDDHEGGQSNFDKFFESKNFDYVLKDVDSDITNISKDEVKKSH